MARSQEYLDLLQDLRVRSYEMLTALVDEMEELHIRKSDGYSGVDEPDTWKNFRGAVDYGATPLQGCLIRKEDKIARVKSLLKNPEAAGDETIEDTWLDEAAYSLIAICLYREEQRAVAAGAAPGTYVPVEGTTVPNGLPGG